jgi:uroporphyrinogen-III decarboxylase
MVTPRMTRRELVRTAIGHREAARIPYLIDFCQDAWETMLPRAGGLDQGAFVDNDVESFNPVWWGWGQLEADWKGFDPPHSRDHVVGRGSYTELFEGMKRARERTDKYILVRIYGSHFEKAYFARGIEGFLADMAGSPEFARRFLTRIIDRNMVMLETMLSAPEIDGVLLGSDWGSQQDLLMSPESWQELIRPGEQREYDLIHAYGKDVWIHSCGNVERIIPSLVEMGVDVLNPVQPEAMDLEGLKGAWGDRLTFWGGLSTQRTLPFGTPDEVREECRAVKRLLGRGGGLIFSPAQSIQSDVPVDNILALLDVAREPDGQAVRGG